MSREGQFSKFRRFFSSRLFLLIAFLAAVLFAIGFARAYYQDYQVKEQIAELEREVQRLEHKKIQSLKILEYVMSPEFVEEKARTELSMQKPGERAAVVAQPGAEEADERQRASGATGQDIPNPLKWWYYFTHRPLAGT